MDRRSILTVILLTLSFFGINYYFDMKRVENTKEQMQAEKKAAPIALSHEEIMRRTASTKGLHLVELYSGEGTGEMIGYGYQQKHLLLTIQGTKKAPLQLYIGNGKTAQPALLISEENGLGMPICYATNEGRELTTVSLPQVGTVDVQVVSLDSKPSVCLGLYESGAIYFPGNTPSENSLVFYRSGGNYYPVGYYDNSNNQYIPLGDIEDFAPHLQYLQPEGTGITRSEEFYVLENDSMQLVISTIGGSLSEINLPLRGTQHPNSIVRSIQFDTIIDKKHPQNALFPEKAYLISDAQGRTVQKQPLKGGYYPLLRRGIHHPNPKDTVDAPIRYNGLNLVSDDPQLSTVRFTATRFSEKELVMEGKYRGRKIVKRYLLPENPQESPYVFDCFLSIQGNTDGIWITSGVPEVELISGSFIPALKYSKMKNSRFVVDQIKQPKPATTVENTSANWASNGNGYFGIIIDPLTYSPNTIKAGQIPGEADPTRISLIDAKYNLYPPKDYPGYELLVPLSQASPEAQFRIFAGPFDTNVLKLIDKTYTDPSTGGSPHYIDTQSFHGWFAFISEPFAKFLLILMNFFHMITGSWGISIILLTVALRIMLYPLNNWSIKSMARAQESGPKIERLREKYKKDPKRLQTETMKVWKEEGSNPFSGCLPMLIQMPFLFGMFDLLKSTFELRGASFIPGWITNLAAPDVVFSWGYPIPFIGTSFHLLPILLGAVMYIQQRSSQKRAKKKHAVMTDQQKQMQQSGKIMTVVFTVLFYKSPSGLNLYWISSMGLSALQQWFTMRQMDRKKQ